MKVTVDVALDQALVEQRYRELEAADPDKGKWLAEVGQVGYTGVAGSEMPVLVTGVGWIETEHYIERVYRVSFLSPDAHGYYTGSDGKPMRVQYGTSTSSIEGEISPEPHDVTMLRWRLRNSIGTYPRYQTEDEWRERPYSMDIPTVEA